MKHNDPHTPARGLRTFAIAALVTALAGCTAFSHRESIERLNSNYGALVEAETFAFEDLPDTATPGLEQAPEGIEPPQSLAEARIQLALDAQRDLEDANATFKDATEYDRVSALYRGALKAWHAGNAWEVAPNESGVDRTKRDAILSDGKRRCDALKEVQKAPPRDCAVIAAARDLTAMEIAAANILDAHIARRRPTAGTEARLATLFKGVRDIAGTLTASMTIPDKGDDGLARFFKRQRVLYLCHATRGMNELVQISALGESLQEQGEEASLWLGQADDDDKLSPTLSKLLKDRDVKSLDAAKGSYAKAVKKTAKVASQEWSAKDRMKIMRFCEALAGFGGT